MESAAGARSVWTLVVGSCTAVSRTWFWDRSGNKLDLFPLRWTPSGLPFDWHYLYYFNGQNFVVKWWASTWGHLTPQPQPVQTPALRRRYRGLRCNAVRGCGSFLQTAIRLNIFIEQGQLTWFSCLTAMPPGHLLVSYTERRSMGKPRITITSWRRL